MQEQKAKQWQWKPEDQFQVDGRTIETCINLVQSILQDPSSAKVVWAMEADKLLSQVMNKGIQDGVIKEKDTQLVGDFIPNDQNHYSKADGETFFRITGLIKDTSLSYGEAHELEISNANLYKVIDGYWIADAELSIFNALVSEGKTIVNFGYIDGRRHHLDTLTSSCKSGYIFWYKAS